METRSDKTKIYSKYWRINRSRQDVTELALSLRAMRKAAGYIGRNVKPIFWKGMVEEDNRSIILDPDVVNGVYPIPHKTFDVLVGQVVLEGLSSIEFDEWVRDKVISGANDLNEAARPYLECLIDAAESIYINELIKPRVWSLYLSSYFRSVLSEDKRDPTLPPSPDSLAGIWKKKEILFQVPDMLHYDYDDLLTVLTQYGAGIKKLASLNALGVRRDKRIELYLEMWFKVYQIISQWETFNFASDAINLFDEAGPKGQVDIEEDQQKDDQFGEEKESQKQNTGGLDQELADDVNAILEEGAVSNRSIAVARQEPGARPMETCFGRGEVKTDIQPDMVQVRQMKRIFKKQDLLIRSIRRKQIRRGLSEGKLDPLRLHRVPLDGKVFKNKQCPGSDYFWQICILADASASMSGKDEPKAGKKRLRRPWEVAEKSFVSLAAAAKGHRNLIDIYAYRAERNICHLTQLFHGGELYSVDPAGRTPSGQAIMAVAMMLNKKFKRSMIVHITDGAANCGLSLGDALNYCRTNGIEVYTIGCGCNRQTRDFLREFFPPGHLYFLKSVHYLADGLTHLFKQKILHSIR